MRSGADHSWKGTGDGGVIEFAIDLLNRISVDGRRTESVTVVCAGSGKDWTVVEQLIGRHPPGGAAPEERSSAAAVSPRAPLDPACRACRGSHRAHTCGRAGSPASPAAAQPAPARRPGTARRGRRCHHASPRGPLHGGIPVNGRR